MTRQEIEALINEFNAQVGSRAWTSARADHDVRLIEAMKDSGIDISEIFDGKTISFSKRIALNEDGTKLVAE